MKLLLILTSIFAFSADKPHNFTGTQGAVEPTETRASEPVKEEVLKPSYMNICSWKGKVWGRLPEDKFLKLNVVNGELQGEAGTPTEEMTAEMTDYYATLSKDAKFLSRFPSVKAFLDKKIQRPRGAPRAVKMFVVSESWCPGCKVYAPRVENLIRLFRGSKVQISKHLANEGRSVARRFTGGIPYTEIRDAETDEILLNVSGAQSESEMVKLLSGYRDGVPVSLEQALASYKPSGKEMIPCNQRPVEAAKLAGGAKPEGWICDENGVCRQALPGEKDKSTLKIAPKLNGILDVLNPTSK